MFWWRLFRDTVLFYWEVFLMISSKERLNYKSLTHFRGEIARLVYIYYVPSFNVITSCVAYVLLNG